MRVACQFPCVEFPPEVDVEIDPVKLTTTRQLRIGVTQPAAKLERQTSIEVPRTLRILRERPGNTKGVGLVKNESPYVFTLVHGTFAADAEWVSGTTEKSFRRMLEDAFDATEVEFKDDFKWGKVGKISRYVYDQKDGARLAGAEELREQLEKFPGDSKGRDPHFIIAHSHGGNVALYALKAPSVKGNVDGVICLATPFLYPRKRPIDLRTLWAAPILAMFFFWLSSDFRRWLIGAFDGWLLVFSIALLVAYLLLAIFVTGRRREASREGGSFKDYYDRITFNGVTTPVLLIRSTGDEASGVLRIGQMLNWAFGTGLSRVLQRIVWVVVFACFILIFSRFPSPESQIPGVTERVYSWIHLFSNYIVAPATYLLLSLAAMLMLATAATRIVAGSDSIKWFGELETMSEESPPGLSAEIITLVPLDPSEAKGAAFLSHSRVYARRETADAIEAWCRRIIQGKEIKQMGVALRQLPESHDDDARGKPGAQ